MNPIQRIWNFAASKGRRFSRDQRGVSTVEYALIVVAIIAILGVAAATLGDAFEGLMGDLTDQMNNASANVAANAS